MTNTYWELFLEKIITHSKAFETEIKKPKNGFKN